MRESCYIEWQWLLWQTSNKFEDQCMLSLKTLFNYVMHYCHLKCKYNPKWFIISKNICSFYIYAQTSLLYWHMGIVNDGIRNECISIGWHKLLFWINTHQLNWRLFNFYNLNHIIDVFNTLIWFLIHILQIRNIVKNVMNKF